MCLHNKHYFWFAHIIYTTNSMETTTLSIHVWLIYIYFERHDPLQSSHPGNIVNLRTGTPCIYIPRWLSNIQLYYCRPKSLLASACGVAVYQCWRYIIINKLPFGSCWHLARAPRLLYIARAELSNVYNVPNVVVFPNGLGWTRTHTSGRSLRVV